MTAPYEIVVLDVGGAALAIPFQRAGQADPEQIGGISRAYAGNQYSSIIAEYMVIPLVSAPVSSAQYAEVKDLFALGAQVDCAQGSAGNVFNGVTSLVTCSGKVTGEMIPGGIDDDGKPLWTMNLTLTEVGSAIPAGATPYEFLLTSVASPDMVGAFVSTPDGSYPGDAGTSAFMLSGATPATAACPTLPGTTTSVSAEIKWLSVPLEAGYVVGVPSVRVETGGVSATVWQHASTKAKLWLYRGGVAFAGPWESEYLGNLGSLGSINGFMVFSDILNLTLVAGDQFYLEFWSRLALNCGQTDDAGRQSIYYGNVPGPRLDPVLILAGDIASL